MRQAKQRVLNVETLSSCCRVTPATICSRCNWVTLDAPLNPNTHTATHPSSCCVESGEEPRQEDVARVARGGGAAPVDLRHAAYETLLYPESSRVAAESKVLFQGPPSQNFPLLPILLHLVSISSWTLKTSGDNATHPHL